MNQIPDVQNEEAQIKLLRARTRIYSKATFLLITQLGLTLGIPIAGGILTIFHPDLKPYVAAASLAVIVLDTIFLDRPQKVLIKRAAKIGEQFDCVVLDLPWDQFSVGDKLENEDIHTAAKPRGACRQDQKLRDWYPPIVGELPPHLARIICQRTNLRYDSQLRRSYGNIIVFASVCVIGALVTIGLVQNESITAWVLIMTPATPFLAWAAREFYRQIDTADQLEALMKEARKFWDAALVGQINSEHCEARSREFQNAIYNRRATSPLVLPLLYRFKRLSLEDEMKNAAENFLLEFKTSKSFADYKTA
jgi:hypothetical protein